jgi:hypothetical protein
MKMVQFSATRCSCIAILWISLVSFAAITLCVGPHRVFIVVVCFVIDPVRKLLDTPLYVGESILLRSNCTVRSKHYLPYPFSVNLASYGWLHRKERPMRSAVFYLRMLYGLRTGNRTVIERGKAIGPRQDKWDVRYCVCIPSVSVSLQSEILTVNWFKMCCLNILIFYLFV